MYPDTKELHIVGGVSANTRLRTLAAEIAHTSGLVVRWPETLRYCTDNAAMIAAAAFFHVQEKPLPSEFHTLATSSLQELLKSDPSTVSR